MRRLQDAFDAAFASGGAPAGEALSRVISPLHLFAGCPRGVALALMRRAEKRIRRTERLLLSPPPLASSGMFMGGGGAAAGEGSGPKKVPIAVVVPVEACGTTPEAEAGIVAEVVALRIVAGSGSAA